ncbi:MAG: hypothetical protein IID42_08890 [Planctomycetes bacterium]|nr:hypothetical protein [Planctomycetota bacterium]
MNKRDRKRKEQDRRKVSQKTRGTSPQGHAFASGQTVADVVELTAPPGGLTSIRDGVSWDCPDYFASEAAENGLFYLLGSSAKSVEAWRGSGLGEPVRRSPASHPIDRRPLAALVGASDGRQGPEPQAEQPPRLQ